MSQAIIKEYILVGLMSGGLRSEVDMVTWMVCTYNIANTRV